MAWVGFTADRATKPVRSKEGRPWGPFLFGREIDTLRNGYDATVIDDEAVLIDLGPFRYAHDVRDDGTKVWLAEVLRYLPR